GSIQRGAVHHRVSSDCSGDTVWGIACGRCRCHAGWCRRLVLSACAGDSFALDRKGALILAVYAGTAALLVYVIHRLNQAIDDLAEERERTTVLFQELQHRVANNMAFLAAVLNLQRRAIQEAPEVATHALDDTVNRLNTMARIHRRL